MRNSCNRDDPVTTFDLAKALQRNGDDAAAVDEFQKGIGLAPNDASVRIALAESYEALNQRPQAAEAYNEYLKLAPSGPDADKARLRVARLTSQPAEPATRRRGALRWLRRRLFLSSHNLPATSHHAVNVEDGKQRCAEPSVLEPVGLPHVQRPLGARLRATAAHGRATAAGHAGLQ